MADRKSGANTVDRNADGTFGKGNPGKPKGARHKTTRSVENLLEGEAEALTRKAIDKALDGDMAALKLCLVRIAPPRKYREVTFALPELTKLGDVVNALSGVLEAVSTGQMTPEEGLSVARLFETQRRLIETEILEARLTQLEERTR